MRSSPFAEQFVGRNVQLVAVPTIAHLPGALAHQASPYLLFLATGTTTMPERGVIAICEQLLRQGAVYACCWGPDSTQLEVCFDLAESLVHEGSPGVIRTTSHEHETLEAALAFTLHNAYPHDAYEEGWDNVIVATVANEDWWKRAEAFLAAGAPLPRAAA